MSEQEYYKPDHEMSSMNGSERKQEFFVEDQEWAQKLESDFQDYIWACEESIDYEEDEDGQPFQTLSGEIFCGCQTCFTREQLFFLVPKIIHAYKNGQIILNEE